MTAPSPTLTLRCDLCDNLIPARRDKVTIAAVDHMIDEHRMVWLTDGITAAMTMIRVHP